MILAYATGTVNRRGWGGVSKNRLGYTRSKPESAGGNRRLFNDLLECGLNYKDLWLVVSDESSAVVVSAEDVLGDTSRQLCWAHRMASLADSVCEQDLEGCVRMLSQMYRAENRTQAH
ncbi:MAG: transposase [Armatimonadetes bacterium]|nr:transposase [Armatimonadota bacterium]